MVKKSERIKDKKEIVTYIVAFFVLVVLNRSQIINVKIPFAAVFAISLVYLNKNGIVIALLYFASSLVFSCTFQNIVITVGVVSSILILYLLHRILNKQISFVGVVIILIVGLAGYIYFNMNTPSQVVMIFVSLIVCVMFLYVCTQSLNAVFFRGVQSRLTIDESVCFALMLIVVFSGLGNFYLFNINVTNMFVVFILLFLSKILPNSTVIYLSVLSGFGVSLYVGNVIGVATYVTYAICIVMFYDKPKIFASISVILIDLLFGFFFNVYAYYSYLNVLSLLFVNIIYLCVPDKFYKKLKGVTYNYSGSLTEEFLVYGQREVLRQKFVKTAELFNRIQNTYRNLSIGELDRKKVAEMLADEVVFKYCKKCVKSESCFQKENIKNAIIQLFEFGIEKGKVSIIDANNLITSECLGLTGLINEINNYILNFYNYEKNIKVDSDNKMIIAEQILGTSNVFKEFSKQVIGGEKINYKASKTLLDELMLNKIVVNEVMVLESENGLEKVILIVRNSDVTSENIRLSLKSVFKINLNLDLCKMTKYAGWSIMCFSPSPKYEISVGVACSNKEVNDVSGDNYSLIKLNNNRILIAISDGMGHGKRANEISTMALNLIENFYQTGFESDFIISSVNKILLPAGEDNFTTLDVCVFNCNDATIDFIKIGASCSVIKSQNTCRVVLQDSLPLGVVNNYNFCAQKHILKDKDVVVLSSDGIVDSFSCFEEFANYVNNENVSNMQMLANNILEEAESRNNGHNDDKTVLVFKVNVKV